ncbi:Trk family potassium uptake protein [Streptococcus pneumoniae]|nr:Trk family potassium uptake protein [Streptococcus pneumoniae]
MRELAYAGFSVLHDEALLPAYRGKIPQSWAGQSLSKLDLRGKYNLNILGFREQENSPLDVEFGPDDLLKADTYILAVINNQYLDTLVALNS